ncbi:MAG TPA: glycosyl hydrolase family 28 protein [Bacteroidales bacterium]|nr:glycosyl hydrolase family 28 protein [Bacteroidales bacterium]
MRIFLVYTFLLTCVLFSSCTQKNSGTIFPDGTIIPSWFSDTTIINLGDCGQQFLISDYGAVNDSTVLQTDVIQKAIDDASMHGNGVIVIPKGIYLTGALFFKPGTKLYLSEGAVIKGSDNIADYPLLPSRMEGQCLDYYSALINANKVDGFSITGKGTIDGNGLKFWQSFWKRREENPQCTNLEVSRPRLLFIRNSKNIRLQDIILRNAGFWTSHYYKCENIKVLNLRITSPFSPVKAPSTDAIDIDACSNVLIRGCYLSVNDDAIALKGGKGPWADKDTCNGGNFNIVIEDCRFGFCHSALTLGSESIHDKNIVMRNCQIDHAMRLLWLKMRPDTPQKYEYVTVENITGEAKSLIYIKPWTQFFDLKGRTDMPSSCSQNIKLRNIDFSCDIFFDVESGKNYRLSHFEFDNISVRTKESSIDKSIIEDFVLKDVRLNNQPIK